MIELFLMQYMNFWMVSYKMNKAGVLEYLDEKKYASAKLYLENVVRTEVERMVDDVV